MIDYTVTMGNIFTLIGFVVSGIIFLIRVEGKLNILIHEKHMEQSATVHKFSEIDAQLVKLAEAIIAIAKQEVRLDGFELRLVDIADKIRLIDVALITDKVVAKSRRSSAAYK